MILGISLFALVGLTLQIRSGHGCIGTTSKPRSLLLYLDVSPRLYPNPPASNPECKATNTMTLATTVIQKTATKLALEYLCRSIC